MWPSLAPRARRGGDGGPPGAEPAGGPPEQRGDAGPALLQPPAPLARAGGLGQSVRPATVPGEVP